MKAIFDLLDVNNDGALSMEELGSVVKSLGHKPPSQAELEQIIIDFDDDGNECIDFTEFVKMMKIQIKDATNHPEFELRNALRVFDKDDRGHLSEDTLNKILVQIGGEKISKEEAIQFIQYVKSQVNSEKIEIEDLVKILIPETALSEESENK